MTHLATRDCACTYETALGQKRPGICPCGNPFLSEAQLNPKPRSPLKRSPLTEVAERERRLKRGSTLKQGRRRETKAEKEARFHFNAVAVLYNPLIGAPLCRKAHDAVTAGSDRIYWQDLSPECLEYIGSLPDFFLLRLESECPKRLPVGQHGEVAA